jgi:hypothetical protein
MTPEQFDRVVHADVADVDAEMRDRDAAHEAELAEIAAYSRQLTRQQAWEIITAATELKQHMGGCNLSVELRDLLRAGTRCRRKLVGIRRARGAPTACSGRRPRGDRSPRQPG